MNTINQIAAPHDHQHTQNRFAVIPTAEKLGLRPGLSGRGVSIAFLDSGFYPHSDIVDRVLAYHDVNAEEPVFGSCDKPAAYHWHGTQTLVSCAGDGSLSNGIYRGLAHEAQLVLVKVSTDGRISDGSIEKGLRWIIKNRERYGIRVLNISLGGDLDLPASQSCVNRLVEQLVSDGVVVTVAAGNSAERRSIPPANAPSVITVGGYSDENGHDQSQFDLYHSSFGPTADGLIKPELIAPAMYVAAPILPGTEDYKAAEALSQLAAAPDYMFPHLLADAWSDAGLGPEVLHLDVDPAREAVHRQLVERKIVATHYQHVDGTSFAAPITASVAALMLEANPSLTPAAVKNILISTARRLSGHPAIRQGFGVINAEAAIAAAEREDHALDEQTHHSPRIERDQIVFSFHSDAARQVMLCGDFTEWRSHPLERNDDRIWSCRIPCQPAGRYRYKFLVDGERWTEDPSHGLKEEDGFGGFHSLLLIG